MSQSEQDRQKIEAARAALRMVNNGDVVGLGTGSTATHFVKLLGERVKEGLQVRGIPTSVDTKTLATNLGIPLTTFEEVQMIDVTVDGADEFDPRLNLIKGGGGALLREKIVASASRQMVVVADGSKRVEKLGRFHVPIEVIVFAQELILAKLAAIGAKAQLRVVDGSPFRTDEGNHILDCDFGLIDDPAALARTLSDMPGIVEHGLFIRMASIVLVADANGVIEVRPESPTKE
ncbi:ribose-5-phosphate isomerase RpiA [Silvibacterium acidisoli]|uniref:ribose-5-phosphate isomerase RpiA n=1 Tax=Acidobacteriaceae bacterium ZG23-2 TaxID=2883246 RepID=UPI00406CD0F8